MESGLGLTAARIVAVGGCAITLLLPAPARADAAQDAITGTWLTEGGDSKVEISRSGTSYGGKVVWLKEAEREGKPVHDANNSNASLRDRPIKGWRSSQASPTERAACGPAVRSIRRAKAAVTRRSFPLQRMGASTSR